MAFLYREDYWTQIKDDHLDQVIDANDSLLDDIEIAAQAEMESYLRSKYDCDDIFGATADRNRLIVMYLVDIALYHLHSRIAPRKIPQIRMDRYDAAILWLKAVAKGDISPNLPRYSAEEDDQETGGFLFGSQKKTSHDLY